MENKKQLYIPPAVKAIQVELEQGIAAGSVLEQQDNETINQDLNW